MTGFWRDWEMGRLGDWEVGGDIWQIRGTCLIEIAT
jgi:hypothetical protein